MIKRLFDIFLSSMGLTGSSPLWLLFSLAIKLEDKGPVFYKKNLIGSGLESWACPAKGGAF